MTLKSTTQEVLLDLVVRDKHGKLVRDIGADDIEVHEDGAAQKVLNFRFRDGKLTPGERAAELEQGRSGASTEVSVNPLREVSLVSIVFENMGPDGRRVGVQFVDDFLNTELGPNTYVGIFTLGHRLGILQPYTNSAEKVRASARRAANSTGSQLTQMAQEVSENLTSPPAGGRGPSGAGAGADGSFQPLRPGSAAERGPATDSVVGEFLQQMMVKENAIVRYSVGMNTMDALRSLLAQQRSLPGRKTVLYLSEGLMTPPGRAEVFRSVISEANRSQVSFYTVDVNGLNSMNPSRRDALLHGGRAGYIPSVTNLADGGVFLQENLAELAESTGGFLMANSNDLRTPLRRVMEDARAHYELTYSPTNPDYNGKFRTVSVEVRRPGLMVQTRKGYYALPDLGGDSLQPFEVPCLKAINDKPLPHDVNFRASALHFRPATDGTIEQVIAFEAPVKDLKITPGPEGKPSRVHLSFLGLVKNDNGEIVQKVSRDIPLEITGEQLAAARNSVLEIQQPMRLAPGRYTLESAAVDRESNLSAARRSALVVVPAQAGLSMSSLVLVRKLSQPSEPDPNDPLIFSKGRVSPVIGDHVTASSRGALSLYFMIYPAKENNGKLTLTFELLKDGKPTGATQPEIPEADQTGAIPIIASVPLANLTAGEYVARATVRQGEGAVQETRAITIDPQ